MNAEEINKGVKLAVRSGWGLSNFKRFISQFLLTENNEDQWTFDFESYCLTLTSINPEKLFQYTHPSNWAVEYYQDRWDLEKMNRSLEDLKERILSNKDQPF